ncbi:MAG: 16S rRNA processing protein RimM [Acidobacteria bacterium]|nr:MAG: 16S rRNA processing protein RimM [Acidobacteriota bacterium]
MNSPRDEHSTEDVVIARIVKARGIRGEVACAVETDFPERFLSLEQVTVWMPDDRRLRLSVENQWFHKDRVILKFEGYDTMTAAQNLAGGRLVISEAELEPLPEGQFFEHQVIGSVAETLDGRQLGLVTKVMRTGGTDVLVVQNDDGREQLIPFADDICTEVDVRAKRITIDPPDGLLDL